MKKLLTLFIAFILVSCNDGDFNVPDFEFEDVVNGCWDDQVLYITSASDTEAMVITLINGELGTEVGTESYSVSSTREVAYRIFNEGIDNNYFCQAIPPTTPIVVKELNAESGTINITTSEILDANNLVTGYNYVITMSDLLFVETNGNQIFFESFEFGEDYEIDVD
jgi:hypothetical protein